MGNSQPRPDASQTRPDTIRAQQVLPHNIRQEANKSLIPDVVGMVDSYIGGKPFIAVVVIPEDDLILRLPLVQPDYPGVPATGDATIEWGNRDFYEVRLERGVPDPAPVASWTAGSGTTTGINNQRTVVRNGMVEHTYSKPGPYMIKITGTFGLKYPHRDDIVDNIGNGTPIHVITQWGGMVIGSMAFENCKTLRAIKATDAPRLGRHLYHAFGNCTALADDVVMNHWDVSNVGIMTSMFEGCTAFNGNLEDWDVSKVTGMGAMFKGCTAFNGKLEAWDVSRVGRMYGMFAGCTAFNGNLETWNVSQVENFDSMFQDCLAFKGDLSRWDVSSAQSMRDMFAGCSKFNCNLNRWQTSNVTDMNSMFAGCSEFNCDLNRWQTSNVTDMEMMFLKCTAFDGDLTGWDVRNVDVMRMMFALCTAFTGRGLEHWVLDPGVARDMMFADVPSLRFIPTEPGGATLAYTIV